MVFICLPVQGHLGRFHLLATGNNTMVNAGVHVDISLQGPAFSSEQKEVEQLDHIIIQCFEEPPHGFAQGPQHLQPPTNSAQFPHTPANACSLHICICTSHPKGVTGPCLKAVTALGGGGGFLLLLSALRLNHFLALL